MNPSTNTKFILAENKFVCMLQAGKVDCKYIANTCITFKANNMPESVHNKLTKVSIKIIMIRNVLSK